MGEADRNVVHGEVDVPGRRSGYVTDENRFDTKLADATNLAQTSYQGCWWQP